MINVLKVLWERGTSKYFKLKSNIKITLKIRLKNVSGKPRHLYVKTRPF